MRVAGTHWHVSGTLSNQPTNKHLLELIAEDKLIHPCKLREGDSCSVETNGAGVRVVEGEDEVDVSNVPRCLLHS